MNELRGLIREYVRSMIEVRSSKPSSGDAKKQYGTKFDFNTFSKLETTEEMIEYASNFLQPLGKGSSRQAFVFSSKYALKIAMNEKGLAQNKVEIDASTDPMIKQVVASVQRADDKHRWLLSDLVRSLKGSEEFESLTGGGFVDFVFYLEDVHDTGAFDDPPTDFALMVAKIMKKANLLYGDIISFEHWGKTPDGRAVLLDYGFNQEVWEKHYKTDQEAKTKIPGTTDDTTQKKDKTKSMFPSRAAMKAAATV